VVQRVPVRIYFDKNDKFVAKLKAGMSVYATSTPTIAARWPACSAWRRRPRTRNSR
jgi:multidrug resistance efflux pump